MKRKNFLASLGVLMATPFMSNATADQPHNSNQTIYKVLKGAFGEKEKLLFKRFIDLFPKEYQNLPVFGDEKTQIRNSLDIFRGSTPISRNKMKKENDIYLNHWQLSNDVYIFLNLPENYDYTHFKNFLIKSLNKVYEDRMKSNV